MFTTKPLKNWRPLGDSNPRYRRERAVSITYDSTAYKLLCYFEGYFNLYIPPDGSIQGAALVISIISKGSTKMKVEKISLGFDVSNPDAVRGRIFNSLLSEVGGKTLVDLGAGPCLFAKKARDKGYQVTAVDGRTERLPNDLGSIKFIQSDVRNFDPNGFDIISVLGLLYHLPVEDQETLLKKCDTTTIVETQVHDSDQLGEAYGPNQFRDAEVSGYTGVIFKEGDNPMASIGNKESFWHTEDSMLKLFENCGFNSVTVVDPSYISKYGKRRFYVARR
jgi:hypothetical protein